MDKEMICLEECGGQRNYHFVCPACGEEGELGLKANERGTFGCPAECGATFVEYKGLAGWAIRCVVQPVFVED